MDVSNNNSLRTPVFAAKYDEKAVINFAAADDYDAGTLMGQVTAAAGTAAADAGNTGDGTITAFELVNSSVEPKKGTYLFTLTAALIGTLTDPDGNVVQSGIALNDGAATVITLAGITFTITDGATAFVATDFFTIPVEAGSYKYAPYASDGVGGLERIGGILTVAKSKAASGDLYGHVLIGGEVAKDALVIDAGGSITDAIINELSNVKDGIIVQDGAVLDEYDNQ